MWTHQTGGSISTLWELAVKGENFDELNKIILYSRKDFIFSQNKVDTASQPRKNNDRYRREYNTFGNELYSV